ncbi:MAG: hypothetical protein A2Y25_06170 [Candidatus Melainabacteria bacterium GWF2_37_15]|nr:MAG: hypothetical protein A2Y25_06170 [Candidatus Melainabacteria bacterium GWF2_37_15]
MVTKNASETRIKRKRVALVTKFAIIIGVSIFYSVFFITAYNIYASSPIVEQYKRDKENGFNAVSGLIYKEYQQFYVTEGITKDFEELVNNLLENNLVLHVGVVNIGNNEYVWSSEPTLIGQKTDVNDPFANEDFKKRFNIENKDNLTLKKYYSDNNFIIISFFQDKTLLNLVEILKNGNFMLGAAFVFFGFLSALLLARQVTKPIEELVIGVWEFSKGNLSYRTPIKSDDEIGILARAFNYMAEKLDDLYISLEQKVKERTVQLSSKNEELNKAYSELKDAQALLVHNEKMRSLGELVAGVAHELNNPINFIYGNMTHLKEYSENLIEIITKYENNNKIDEINNFKEEVEYDFIKDDIRELIKSCIEGAERSKNIVLELKNFSRLDQGVIKEIKVNESIDSTLSILMNKYKNKVNIHKEYSDLPMLNCYAGQINQVFMNIIDNAAQAIDEDGNVYIRTRLENESVVIEIEDTGSGIDEEILPKIFDPFFTTKAVGSGSGLGLSITYKIVKSHNGTIDVKSEKGKGTKFIVKIPLNWEQQQHAKQPEETENLEEAINE